MEFKIRDEILNKENMSKGEFYTLLVGYFADKISDVYVNQLKNKYLVDNNNEITGNGIEIVERILVDSEYYDDKVNFDELAEIKCISIQIVILHNELRGGVCRISHIQSIAIACTIGVVMAMFHPLWRTPWRRPEFHIRILLLRFLDKSYNELLVTLNREMLHQEVCLSLCHLITTIPGT